jgi:hypothetical protein
MEYVTAYPSFSFFSFFGLLVGSSPKAAIQARPPTKWGKATSILASTLVAIFRSKVNGVSD